ncbi:hypothetical protein DFH07DRAFT_783442 [Mycena maculata]|uniref:Uncharacterized protein n=1 Tax=Mycena maculata TaxID=230809 RepID=A0AAD7MM37_9AGAR|nr:hypothetical protein DFH07DRAFT_783442 [Mycena maculata]
MWGGGPGSRFGIYPRPDCERLTHTPLGLLYEVVGEQRSRSRCPRHVAICVAGSQSPWGRRFKQFVTLKKIRKNSYEATKPSTLRPQGDNYPQNYPSLPYNFIQYLRARQCALGVDAVQEFVRSGWSLRDIWPSNFILTGGPGAWAVVIINLFLLEPIKFIANDQPQSFFLKFVSCVYSVNNDIFEWAEKKLPFFVWSPVLLDSGCKEQAVNSESVGSDMA